MSTPIVAEALARAVDRARAAALPPPLRSTLESLLIDIGGLCVAARRESYVRAAIDSWEANGESTVIGHGRALDSAGAAFVNGTAAHGEDFDDTFEGGPVHSGVVIVPALLAAAERHRIAGRDLAFGIAVGVEVMCRASLVAPKRIHQAGFHPTAVLGAMGASKARRANASHAPARSASQPPCAQLARNFSSMSPRESGSLRPPRRCGWRSSIQLPSAKRTRTWPVYSSG